LNGIQEVGGSIPPGSTKFSLEENVVDGRRKAAFLVAAIGRATMSARTPPLVTGLPDAIGCLAER
jgi:hypothetical protein